MGVKQWQMSAKNQEFFPSIFSAKKASRLSSLLSKDIFKTSLHSTVGKFLGNGCICDFEEKLPLIFQDIWPFSHLKAKEMLLISDFPPSPLFTRELLKN